MSFEEAIDFIVAEAVSRNAAGFFYQLFQPGGNWYASYFSDISDFSDNSIFTNNGGAIR